eukprot:CAMPEP_0114559936 /NCGR_PEP_ID=MMETSP0114-20121206/11187_1 /TAXON_ID=31324 /ORGANISM="Goniomonas sp, Strain m" /LENGTH=196 /DNA_ID=CAMNT_0001745439 /DNA_START=989 /DNA_END=1582 /DNA_ORIENTATION=-
MTVNVATHSRSTCGSGGEELMRDGAETALAALESLVELRRLEIIGLSCRTSSEERDRGPPSRGPCSRSMLDENGCELEAGTGYAEQCFAEMMDSICGLPVEVTLWNFPRACGCVFPEHPASLWVLIADPPRQMNESHRTFPPFYDPDPCLASEKTLVVTGSGLWGDSLGFVRRQVMEERGCLSSCLANVLIAFWRS